MMHVHLYFNIFQPVSGIIKILVIEIHGQITVGYSISESRKTPLYITKASWWLLQKGDNPASEHTFSLYYTSRTE